MSTQTTRPIGAADVIERRLDWMHLQPSLAIAIVGFLVVLVGDTQSLALIPLITPMEAEYHLTAGQGTIILAILGIVGAGAIPVLTRLADRFGMRRLMLISLSIGTVGNLLCSIAPGFTLLVLGRILLGFSAAAPITLALLRERSTTARGTNRGIGMITAAIGLGVAVSFLLGGVVLAVNGTVHTVFWIMTVLAALTLVVGWFILPDHRARTVSRIDYPGAAGLVIGLTALALGISLGSGLGWTSAATLGMLISGAIVMVLWVFWELSASSPMIDLRSTFRRFTTPAYFINALLVSLAIYDNLGIVTYVEMPSAVGYGFGGTVLVASLFLMPTAFFVMFGGFITAPIIAKLGIKRTLILSASVVVVTFVFLAVAHTEPWQLLIGAALWGFGFSVGYAASGAAFLHAAPDGQAAMFSSAASTITSSVGGLGAPVFTAVLTAVLIKGTPIPAAQSFTNLWTVALIAGVIMLILAFVYKRIEYRGAEASTVAGREASANTPM